MLSPVYFSSAFSASFSLVTSSFLYWNLSSSSKDSLLTPLSFAASKVSLSSEAAASVGFFSSSAMVLYPPSGFLRRDIDDVGSVNRKLGSRHEALFELLNQSGEAGSVFLIKFGIDVIEDGERFFLGVINQEVRGEFERDG